MRKLLSILLIAFLAINTLTVNHVYATIEDESQVVNEEAITEEPIIETIEDEESVPAENLEEESKSEEDLVEEAGTNVIENEESEEISEGFVDPEENEDIDEVDNTIDSENSEEIDTNDVEDNPIVGLSSPEPESEDSYFLGDIEQYFDLDDYNYIDEDNIYHYTFDGDYFTPELYRNSYGPEFAYRVDLVWVSEAEHELIPLLYGARDAGKYILHATISYSTAKTIVGEIIFHKTKTIRIPFIVDKKVLTEEDHVSVGTLTYNGQVQFPELALYGNTMVEGRDFVVISDPIVSKDAYKTVEDPENPGEYISEQCEYDATIRLFNYDVDGDFDTDDDVDINYTIDKRELTVNTSYTDEYNSKGLLPKIATNNNNVTLTLGTDYTIESITSVNEHTYTPQEDGKYVLYPNTTFENHNPYDVVVKYTQEFLNNNIVDVDENNTATYEYTIEKAKLNLDFKPLYYNGENQKPVFYERDGKIDDIANYLIVSDPRTLRTLDGKEVYGSKEIGSYYVDVQINPVYANMFRYYVWDEDSQYFNEDTPNVLTVGYRINLRNVEFKGWRLDNPDENGKETMTAYLGSLEVDFNWKVDNEGNAFLEYNGFNPFLFRTAQGKCPIPAANYVWYDETNNEHEVTDIDRADCTYLPLIPSEAFKLDVGNYYVNICLENDYYAASNVKASFEVTPKPVTINWTNTTIDISSEDTNPEYEIEGLAPIDKLGFKLVRTEDGINWETTDKIVVEFGDYYKYESPESSNYEPVAHYPIKYRPQAVGRYKVDVKDLVYRLTGLVTPNYVLVGDTSVSYVVVDKSTEHENGHIHVGTIDLVNKDEIASIDLTAPTETEMMSIISKLDLDIAEKFMAALNAEKNIDVYLVAKNKEDTSGLNLPTQRSIVLDLELFASIEGSDEQVPIHDTGTYNVGIEITLTKQQAEELGYGPGRCFYIARYHGTNTPTNTQIVDPVVSGTGEDMIYTFRLNSNKFSDFCIYTGVKPNIIPVNPDHIVPYTGA